MNVKHYIIRAANTFFVFSDSYLTILVFRRNYTFVTHLYTRHFPTIHFDSGQRGEAMNLKFLIASIFRYLVFMKAGQSNFIL